LKLSKGKKYIIFVDQWIQPTKLRKIINEDNIVATTTLWCDNLGAMALASNLVYHAQTKHIEVDYHFIMEKVLNKDISLQFIFTHDQPVDLFTKGLTTSRFQFFCDKLLVITLPIRLRGDVNNREMITARVDMELQ
jgi:regulatory protein YycH of two-component signal transduction system YycFG